MPQRSTKNDQARFHDEGYLVKPNVLDEAGLAPVLAEYAAALDAAATTLHSRGLIRETWPDRPFGERYTQIASTYPATRYFPPGRQ